MPKSILSILFTLCYVHFLVAAPSKTIAAQHPFPVPANRSASDAGRNLKLLQSFPGGGSLDLTFSQDGKALTDFSGVADLALAVAVQPDGKILVAGLSNADFDLARYNPDGSLDIAFNGSGFVSTDFAGGNDEVQALAVMQDGRIIAAGLATVGTNYDFAVARYNADGSLDASFDGDGKVTTDLTGVDDFGISALIQPDGKIVVVGDAGTDLAVVRYNPDGSLDAGFGGGGFVTTDFNGGFNAGNAVGLQPDGKILAAGRSAVTDSDFAVARYNPDGSLDASFDGDGKVTTDFALGDDFGSALVLQPDGKIIIAGYSIQGALDFGLLHRNPDGGNQDFALARYNADGSLDTSFDGDGKVTTDVSGSTDTADAIGLLQNGAIIAAGYAFMSSNNDFAVARYNPDGSLDTTFDGDGIVTTDLGGNDTVSDLALQPDEKMVIVGFSSAGLGANDFALARYINTALFYDDFEDNDDSSWTFTGKGSWDATNADLISTGMNAIARSPVLNAPAIRTAEANVRIVTAGARVSLFGWYVDKKHSVELRLMQDKGKILLKVLGGGVKIKGKFLTALNAGQYYNVKLVFDGAQFRAYLDGSLIITVNAATVPSGDAAFQVKAHDSPKTGSMADIAVY